MAKTLDDHAALREAIYAAARDDAWHVHADTADTLALRRGGAPVFCDDHVVCGCDVCAADPGYANLVSASI